MKLSTRIARARTNVAQIVQVSAEMRAAEGNAALAKALISMARSEIASRTLLPLAKALHPNVNLVMYLTNLHGDGPGRMSLLATDMTDRDLMDLALNILGKLGADPTSGIGLVNLTDPSAGGDLDTLLNAVFGAQDEQEDANGAAEGQDTGGASSNTQETAQGSFAHDYGRGGGSQN